MPRAICRNWSLSKRNVNVFFWFLATRHTNFIYIASFTKILDQTKRFEISLLTLIIGLALGGNRLKIFYLRNIKHFPCWYTVISTRVEIGKTRNCVKTRRPQGGVHWSVGGVFSPVNSGFHTISSFSNFHECWYNCISIRKKMFYISFII